MSAGHALETPQDQHATLLRLSYDAFGVVGWISDDHVLGQPLDPRQLPGVTAGRADLAYDWCLFELNGPRLNRAIHPCGNPIDDELGSVTTHPILVAENPHFHDGTSDPVLVLGAAAGPRRGEISGVQARIWLAHSECFVDAYVLETDDDEGMLIRKCTLS